jgi:hypothetical protein
VQSSNNFPSKNIIFLIVLQIIDIIAKPEPICTQFTERLIVEETILSGSHTVFSAMGILGTKYG